MFTLLGNSVGVTHALADLVRHELIQQAERDEPERLIQALDYVVYSAGFGDRIRQEVLDIIVHAPPEVVH